MKRVLLTLVLFKIHSDIFKAENSKNNSEKNDPKKDGLNEALEFILDGYDSTKNPCTSFFSTACGNWVKNNEKNNHKEQFGKSFTLLKEQWLSELKKIDVHHNETKDYVKSIRVFFDQCLNAKFDKTRETIELYKAVEKVVGPISIFDENKNVTDLDVWALNGALQRFLQSQFLFHASVEQVVKDCDRVPTLIFQPLTDFNEMREYEESLESRVIALANHLNVTVTDRTYIKNKIDDMTALRRRLQRLYIKFSDFDTVHVKLKDLPTRFPNVDWRSYFEYLFADDFMRKYGKLNPYVHVRSSFYFRNLSYVLSETENKTIVNFAYFQVMRRMSKLLKDRFEEMSSGNDEMRCFDLTLKHMLPAILRHHFDTIGVNVADWKYDIELIMQSLSSAFRYMVTGLDWLDSREKMIIVKKVRQINLQSIPDWITDDEEIEKRSPHFNPTASLYENDLLNEEKKFRKAIQRLLNPKKVVDPDPVFDHAAFYREKTIDLRLGFALPPFYHIHYPLAKKYGTLGWILAHELMHAFDSFWLPMEKITGVKGWLNNDTLKLFNEKNHCLMKQYSKFCYHDLKRCVPGRRTINDNIADVNGLKIAYLAYKFASQTLATPEPRLPSILNTTNDRLFFLSAARIWCGSGEEILTHISIDEHAPRHARVDVSMKNFPIFAKTYNCPVGSNLAPLEICSLWGDVVDPW